MDIISFITVLVSMLFPSFQASMAADSILQSNSTVNVSMRIVSKGGSFELGFFSPGNSGKHYLGIWYKNIPIQTVVWVANRVNPVNDSSATATLTLNTTGSLVLAQNDTVIWYSTTPLKQVQNPVAELLDSGNLVVREEKDNNPEAYLWQSFDYPTDTLLSGMKLGCNLRTGLNRRLTSWKTPEDPSPGEFSITIEPRDYPELYIMKGDSKFFRTGPWNGVGFSGSPELRQNLIFDFGFVSTRYEMSYYWHGLENSSVISRYVINQTEEARIRYVWSKDNEDWIIYTKKPSDNCDNYKRCGPNGKCVITASPACQCLKGFTPKSPQKWNSVDYSDGCIRIKPLNCSEEHKFMKLEGLKVPETAQSWLNETMNLEQCRQKCSENCSCTAYTNSDIRGAGRGCALWFGDLIDIRTYATGGQDLYVRMPASELESGNKRKLIMIVAITIAAILCLLLVGGYFIYKIYRNRIDKSNNAEVEIQNNEADDLDLPLFDLPTIAQATENFSEKNKIGQGGFGPVYWGKLLNGQEVAVKKLSRRSELGSIEFKNEVKFIVKLQHRNLVKLLGCCIEEQEKLLVYEYMPNGSLDSFIFDETKKKLLDWSKHFHIIMGIGRGILYLHQDSRLRIIHRDLKASNILLDDKLIPKISDFGLAKNFGEEEIEGSTKRIVGTYGYMAPEYAAGGLYSVKSDVFSYGILVLEIISGKKNKGFYQEDSTHNLVANAWLLWKEGKVLELLDKNMQEQQWNVSEALRCIHVSLLCVQQNPDDRPTIASAILMLESEVALPEPKEPGFFHGMASLKVRTSSSSQKEYSSANDITISLLDAR